MSVLGLSFLLYLIFALVGRAVLLLLPTLDRSRRAWLLAPPVGLATVLLAATYLNQGGLPAAGFARPLAFVLVALALGLLTWRREKANAPGLGLHALLALAVLAYAGWPAFTQGFAWISYANDDMANYCLGASRLQTDGFYRTPTLGELGGTDYSQYYWFMHVGGLARFGSELLLAWVAELTDRSPLDIFMATILSFGLVQLSATAALAALHPRRWRFTLTTVLLLAVSPLFLLGIYYQLIAQVCGLALMIAVVALLCAPPRRWGWPAAGWTVVTGLCSGALCLAYPEVTPFAALVLIMRLGLLLFRRPRAAATNLLWALAAAACCILLLRENVFSYGITLVNQVQGGTTNRLDGTFLFPYFLVPAGLGSVFGQIPIELPAAGPRGAGAIILGAVALAAVAAWTAFASKRRHPFALLAAVMLLLGAQLFFNRHDFGLFKLAMFVQPALAAMMASLLWWRPLLVGPPLAAILLLQLPTARHYAQISRGGIVGSFAEVAVPGGVIGVAPGEAPPGPAVGDAAHIVGAKLAALAAKGRSLEFPSRDFFRSVVNLVGSTAPYEGVLGRWHPQAEVILHAKFLAARRNWDLGRPVEVLGTTVAESALAATPESARFLRVTDALELYNGLHSSAADPRQILRWDGPRPLRLSFVHTELGEHYYLAGRRQRVSYNSPEADPYRPGGSMTGHGRFLLFRLERPTQSVYLRISAAKSLLGAGRTEWPGTARVLGRHPVPAGMLGAGSANLYVGPVEPLWAGGAAFVALDYGEEGRQHPIRRGGVQAIFGADVQLDPRFVVAYARDISCLSPEDYHGLARPRQVARFPEDLMDAGTEYTGWFEDGWISRHSAIWLAPARPGESLTLRGTVPGIGRLLESGQTIAVTLNGEPQGEQRLPAGPFSLRFDVPAGAAGAPLKVELRFGASAGLIPPDERPVAAKIDFLGLTPE